MNSRSNLMKIGLSLLSVLFLSTTCEQSPTGRPSILSHHFDVLVMGAGGRIVNHKVLFSVPPAWQLDSVSCSVSILSDYQISIPEEGTRWIRQLELSLSEQGRGPESEAEGIPAPACVPTDNLCLYFSEAGKNPLRICSLGKASTTDAPDYR